MFKDIVSRLGNGVRFGYGKTTDFNQSNIDKDDIVWMDPLNKSYDFTLQTTLTSQWTVDLLFYGSDQEDSCEEDYSRILGRMDTLAESFIHQLHQTEYVVISGVNQTNFIKATADILTGWRLTFTLQVPDNFDYCSLNDC